MLRIDMPNARLMSDSVDEEFSELSGRVDYCKNMGFKVFTKAYRHCRERIRLGEKAKREQKKLAEQKSLSSGKDWVVGDNVSSVNKFSNVSGDGVNSGQPSALAKDTNKTDDKIFGMEKPVAIPIIAVSLLAIGITTYFLIKKTTV